MNEELVNRIVNEVLQALGHAPAVAKVPGVTAAPSAAVRKSPGATPKPAATGTTPARHTAAQGAAVAPRTAPRAGGAKVFVTADMLRQRQAGSSDRRTVQLAWNEVLTPNAVDLAQQMHLAVKKADGPPLDSASSTGPASSRSPAKPPAASQPLPSAREGTVSLAGPSTSTGPSASDSLPVGLLLDRADEKVSGLVAGLVREGLRLVDFGQTDCVLRNVSALCEALRAGQVARGVVVAPYAASLLALAGKHKGVRPVQATRLASVEAGVRQFGANLLVVEHAFCTFHEIRAMVRSFVSGPDRLPTDKALTDALARLDER